MSSPHPRSTEDLHTAYRGRNLPRQIHAINPPPAFPSRAGDLADNMPTGEKTPSRISSIAKSIDAVVDSPVPAAATTLVRPLAKLRPSWIGPPRQEIPAAQATSPAMKQLVKVEFSSPGLKPPVYIFTNLSVPKWEPVQMQTANNPDGGYSFFKSFDVEEGEYQYKFRLGPGDWWVYDESRPTIDDGHGNENNLVVVKSDDKKPQAGPEEKAQALPKPSDGRAVQNINSNPTRKPLDQHPPQPESLLKQEKTSLTGSATQETPDHEFDNPFLAGVADDPDADQVLMEYERRGRKSVSNEAEVQNDDDSDSCSSCSSEEDDSNDPPLLPHESLSPSSAEQHQAPLFRHESIALGYNHHEPAAPLPTRRASAKTSTRLQTAHHNDSSLEKFPTDRRGILSLLERAHANLPEDRTNVEVTIDSEALSEASNSNLSLPVLHETKDEVQNEGKDLVKIREAEEEEFAREEAAGEEMDPLLESESGTKLISPPLTPVGSSEPDADEGDFEPHPRVDSRDSQPEVVEIEERIVVEVIQRRSFMESVLGLLGGRINAIVVAAGFLVLAAGIATMQFK